MKYLKDKQYYEDLYDSFTIERCRRMEKSFVDTNPEDLKDLNLKERKRFTFRLGEMAIYFYKGERYSKKSETIFEWMERDRRKDDKLDSVKAPEHIRCPKCNQVMDLNQKTCIGALKSL